MQCREKYIFEFYASIYFKMQCTLGTFLKMHGKTKQILLFGKGIVLFLCVSRGMHPDKRG